MCDLTISPIIGEDGQIRAYVGIQRDITEKARMREELLESHNRYDQLAKQSRYIAWETDSHGRFRYVSHVVRDVLGFEPADLVGKKYFYDLYVKNKRESLKASSYGIFTSGSSFENLVIPLETKTGDLVYVSVNGLGLFDNNRKLLGFRGSFTDITEKKQLEDAVFNEKELFKTTLLSVGDGIISTDNHGSIIMMNKVAEDVTGWTLAEARGKPLQEVLVQRKNPETELDSFLIARNGTERSIETNTSPIQDIQGNANGMVLVFRDCTERKKKQEEIAFLSYHDQLTGVFNRRYYEQRIRMFADGINHPMALVMADVNGLKLINDGFGHNAGDQLLQRIAQTLIRCSGPNDVVARIGGDEFIMLLPRTDAVGTQSIIARILQELTEEQNRMFEISISFGFAIMESPEETYGSVFKLAEDRMYRNKLSESSSARSKTIDSLLYSLFEKSKREMMHSRRVGAICETMALKLQFPSNEVSEMKTAGLMHDIGKMAISDNILNKSDPLTDYEWLEIKRHPEVGYNILSAVNKYAPLAEYVLCHHERWDGKGYPRGLTGEEIPIQARIIAIADAYDAMVSERPYKKRSCKEDAVNELLACAGKQYDPELVKLFISCLT
jgi:diguanylate cyclase